MSEAEVVQKRELLRSLEAVTFHFLLHGCLLLMTVFGSSSVCKIVPSQNLQAMDVSVFVINVLH